MGIETAPGRGTTVRVTPRPVQDPMPIHLGGSAPRAIETGSVITAVVTPPIAALGRSRLVA